MAAGGAEMRRPRFACPCCEPGAAQRCETVLPAPGRRGFLAAALGLGGAALLPAPGAVAQAISAGAARHIAIQRVQTQEGFAGAYWRDGRYVREALAQLDWLFRDPSMEEATPMDPRLFDVLFTISQRLGTTEPFQVISGYRAPETNAVRARSSRRVSRVSLHMSGMAADVRLPGRDSFGMARLAAEMQTGGVGLYRRDGFVHLDCGPARRW
jgi:uncharacterized protein YcbK (DUF882 family)